MAGPNGMTEIEDVLSSIRRLVAAETRPAAAEPAPAAPPPPEPKAERLVLTPALRIDEPETVMAVTPAQPAAPVPDAEVGALKAWEDDSRAERTAASDRAQDLEETLAALEAELDGDLARRLAEGLRDVSVGDDGLGSASSSAIGADDFEGMAGPGPIDHFAAESAGHADLAAAIAGPMPDLPASDDDFAAEDEAAAFAAAEDEAGDFPDGDYAAGAEPLQDELSGPDLADDPVGHDLAEADLAEADLVEAGPAAFGAVDDDLAEAAEPEAVAPPPREPRRGFIWEGAFDDPAPAEPAPFAEVPASGVVGFAAGDLPEDFPEDLPEDLSEDLGSDLSGPDEFAPDAVEGDLTEPDSAAFDGPALPQDPEQAGWPAEPLAPKDAELAADAPPAWAEPATDEAGAGFDAPPEAEAAAAPVPDLPPMTAFLSEDDDLVGLSAAEDDDADLDGADLFESDGALPLDEVALREIVAEIIRDELRGALGDRLARNLRRLVRREIELALAGQGLNRDG